MQEARICLDDKDDKQSTLHTVFDQKGLELESRPTGSDGRKLNLSLLVDNSWPQFTDCFQDTVLTYVPCGWLWLTSIVHLIYLRNHTQYFQFPTSCIFFTKVFCSFCLAFAAVIHLLVPLDQEVDGDNVRISFYVGKCVWAASFTYAGILQWLSHRSGINSPCIVFIFWSLSLVCHIIPTYSVILTELYKTDILEVGLTYLTLSLIVVQLIVQCFGNKNYINLQPSIGTRPCPSTGASFPSKVLFSWVFSVIYEGYKKTIVLSDLSDLPPYMQCRNIVPEFIQLWTKRMLPSLQWRNAFTKFDHHISNRPNSNGGMSSISIEDIPTEKTRLLKSQNNCSSRRDELGVSFRYPERKQPSLYNVLFKIHHRPLIKAQFVGLLSDMLAFANPMLLDAMIDYTSNKDSHYEWFGFVLATAFFFVVFLTSVMTNYRFYTCFNIGTQIKTSLTAAVYKKSLTMNSDSRQKFTVGMTVNLMAVDCPRFQDLITSLWAVVSCPIQVALSFYMLYDKLGISSFAGIGILLLIIPLQTMLSNRAKNAQAAQITHKDQRVMLMNEMLSGIRVLKLYAWETSFQKNVNDIRQKEIAQLKKTAYYQAMNVLVFLASPLMMMLASFIMYVFVSPDNTLTPSVAFVSMSIFNMLKIPMNNLPNLISSFLQCHVSMRRLRDYLSGEDLEALDTTSASDEHPVIIKNGTFSWDHTMSPVLTNVTAQIPRGKLVAVVGHVGAGKSSFLSALLGEMNRNKGWASIKGTIGYVPQQAWIQNVTLKENILFGKEMDKVYYRKVIKACALEPDLELLPGGENTEIGEKGINLSGGQKQRISLARAVYQDSDVFLLDDPLSAVDAHVGKHIFDNVLSSKGLIKGKTRVLVTHGIHWLPLVDSIIVMDQGRITESGSYGELLSHDGPFAQFVKTYLLEHCDEEIDSPEVQKLKDQVIEQVEATLSDEELPLLRRSLSALSESSKSLKSHSRVSLRSEVSHMSLREKSEMREREQLIAEETSETGKVKKEVFMSIFYAFGLAYMVGVLCFLFMYNGVNIGGSIWLSEWTADTYLANTSHRDEPEYSSLTVYYLGVYSMFSILQIIGNAFFLLLLLVQFVNASQRLHNAMLENILHQSVAFFDTTPLGRILNRFSRDVDVVDSNLSRQTRITLNYLFSIITVVIVISYTNPVFLAVMVPISVIYVLFQKFYIPSSRQFRRLESITRSPIFSHFAETISGASTIRAFNVSDRFFQDSLALVDSNNKCFYATASSGRWLRVRLEFLGNLIVLFCALFAVVNNSISASLVGLSITYALQVTNALNILVQNATQLETNAVSLERIVEYSSIPREPSWEVFETKPDFDWPQHGRVQFCGYSTRYRPGLDLVLKTISFNVNPGEKVGIVGRTGAGKSSLSLSLFRVIEAAEGRIFIDGVDIAGLGLHDLRSCLTILPQDPVLFSGSLQFNLDPFSNHEDSAVWQALDNAHIGDFVREMPGGLGFVCEEGGQNLSVGQRQLVCLARSLLRKTKILVLDEATAAVDLETDHLLQQTIREAFKDCTVLTVAHRLKTVIDYDKILVLSQGHVLEFDTPQNLMDDESSVFHSMAKDSCLI